MAQFFKKHRKGTVSGGKARKYILYALGEIVLVVLGILIAVSINAWTQHRKDREEEERLKTNFLSDLRGDLEHLQEIMALSTSYKQQIDSIFVILQKPTPSKKGDFLRYQIAVVNENYFSANNGTFAEATSSGKMTFLRSENLRQRLFEYYNPQAGYQRVDNAAFQFSTQIGTPTLLEEIAITKEGMQGLGYAMNQLPELNLTELSANTRYLAMLSGKASIHANQIQAWAVKQAEAREIIALLNSKAKSQE